jgi:hypothetical protein
MAEESWVSRVLRPAAFWHQREAPEQSCGHIFNESMDPGQLAIRMPTLPRVAGRSPVEAHCRIAARENRGANSW